MRKNRSQREFYQKQDTYMLKNYSIYIVLLNKLLHYILILTSR